MCKTPVKSPVNTGEQPTPETAPSLTETNGQSQPLPEVVPAEDWAQPPPEQVAPPTATDVCPELPSSGDIAPLPATDTEESRKLPDNHKTVTTGVKQKKRKRINGNVERNVKKKPSKSTSPDSPSDIDSQVASDDEQSVNLKVPKRRRGVTRYTVAKQQLDDALKETVRLRSVITLL